MTSAAPTATGPAIPAPLHRGELARVSDELDGGAPWRETWEEFLRALPAVRSDALMLLAKESRGAWICLLESAGGEALFLGNALSGTVVALAEAGFHVTVMDPVAERLRFGEHRNHALAAGQTAAVAASGAARLPFEDGAFVLVVQEGGLPDQVDGWGHDLDECRRVCSGEFVLSADNRLAYKRSSGLRADFRVPTPWAWLQRAVRPQRAEHTLSGYRKLLKTEVFPASRSFSLYPHSRDFTHVVGLDGDGPELAVGLKERENPAKVTARALGLFPWLTPSFALVTARRRNDGPGAPRLQRVLDLLADRLGEPAPCAENLIATRSNTAVIHTMVPGAPAENPAGRWTIHVPLSPHKRVLCSRHMTFLKRVRRDFQEVPVPEPLFEGEIDGLWFTCERRLPGLTAPQLTGNEAAMKRMYADAARQLASLAHETPSVLDEEEYERLVGDRFRLVSERCGRKKTAFALRRMETALREVVQGMELPFALYHADPRSKHLQVEEDGSIIGYLDWGASEERFLPYVDLLHLIVHQRKQEADITPRQAWDIVREHQLRDHEQAALADYAHRLGLDAAYTGAIEAAWPALVAGMAELNWDYSRPLWIFREYQI